jgi:hypothetical protein
VTLWKIGKKADDQLDGQTCNQFPAGWTAPAPKLTRKRARTATKTKRRTGLRDVEDGPI